MIKGLENGILYHYTDFEAFQSILASSSLWLNHYLKVRKDKTEIKFGIEIVKKAALEKFGEITDKTLRLLLIDSIKAPKDYYFSCFCPFPDNAHLWKEYGKGFRGVAIGFDVRYFAYFLKWPEPFRPVYIFRVDYGVDAFTKEVTDQFDNLKIPALYIKNGIQEPKDLWDIPYYVGARNTISESVARATMLKATKYDIEQEWRLIHSPDFDHAPLPLSKDGKRAVFQFPLSAIREIRITDRGKYRLPMIKTFLESIGLNEIPIIEVESTTALEGVS